MIKYQQNSADCEVYFMRFTASECFESSTNQRPRKSLGNDFDWSQESIAIGLRKGLENRRKTNIEKVTLY